MPPGSTARNCVSFLLPCSSVADHKGPTTHTHPPQIKLVWHLQVTLANMDLSSLPRRPSMYTVVYEAPMLVSATLPVDNVCVCVCVCALCMDRSRKCTLRTAPRLHQLMSHLPSSLRHSGLIKQPNNVYVFAIYIFFSRFMSSSISCKECVPYSVWR